MRTLQQSRRASHHTLTTGRGTRRTWNPTDERPLIQLKRNRTRSLLALVNSTLRGLKIAAVPASPWHILAACAGEAPSAKTQRIADALETTVPCLSDTVAIMEREMVGQGDVYWDANVLMSRLRAQRERMVRNEQEGTYGA